MSRLARRAGVVLAAAALGLAACATPYQPEGYAGGYTEIQMRPKAWIVTFRGNGYTGSSRAQDMALLRACDLVLEAGCTHYQLVDAKTVSRYGGTVLTHGYYSSTAVPINKPESQIGVECASPGYGMPAQPRADALRQKYGIELRD
ncbi:MAG TPA: hypothetical protein VMR86_10210 [Myxococcota bacterium]|nr:hypothetical protein [Myxococcota bacterium]